MKFLTAAPWHTVGVVLPDATRNAIVDAVAALCNSGTIQFDTSGDVEVATCTFGATAFGAAASGVGTANAITDDTNATGGVIGASHVKLKTSGAVLIMTCTATTTGGGGEFEGSSLTIAAGETVSVTSLTFTQPAS
jgi:hypothetical protein